MKISKKSPLALAVGSVVLSAMAGQVQAESNPFAMTELSGGYMQVAVDLNNKVSETGCGAQMKPSSAPKKETAKKAEGSCGQGMCGAMMSDGKMKKGMESSCGAMMKGKEGACGMGMNQDAAGKDAKAAEASCGAMMGKSAEASCGAMMKSGEGSCGSKATDK
ncbi:MAG: hypothetical protein ABL925_01870 [Methylococcales bacterium]